MAYTMNKKNNPKKFKYKIGVGKDVYYFSNKKEAEKYNKKEHILWKSSIDEVM